MPLQPESNVERPQEPRKILSIPDTMARWPWPRIINPHCAEVHAESIAWISTFSDFTKDSRLHCALENCDFGLLAALAYPTALKERLRVGCDLMFLILLVDEYTDSKGAASIRELIDIVVDALNYPHKSRPQGETFLGQVAKEFWERALGFATPGSAKRFIETFTAYLESIVAEVRDQRGNKTLRTIEEHFYHRRENIAARPSGFPGELHLNLPDIVFSHPVIKEMEYLAADLMA